MNRKLRSATLNVCSTVLNLSSAVLNIGSTVMNIDFSLMIRTNAINDEDNHH